MKWLVVAEIAVMLIVLITFVVQNFQPVTVALASMRFTLPMALLAIVLYVLGMATGGLLLNLLRGTARRAGALRA